jgi:hypothetical protein
MWQQGQHSGIEGIGWFGCWIGECADIKFGESPSGSNEEEVFLLPLPDSCNISIERI